jgi:hypothetical protein
MKIKRLICKIIGHKLFYHPDMFCFMKCKICGEMIDCSFTTKYTNAKECLDELIKYAKK